jgi:hypothetical protein
VEPISTRTDFSPTSLDSEASEPRVANAPTQQNSVEVRRYCEDNGFNIPTGKAHPDVAGDVGEQASNALWLAQHSASAAMAKATAGRAPFEEVVKRELALVDPTPPLAHEKAERSEYRSHISGVPPEKAFEYAVRHPEAMFASAGITLRPSVAALSDGARLFLEEPGMIPPVWAPVEVRIDEDARRITFTTLQGHPLRGINEFSFDSDGEKGTRLTQRSVFQLSSEAAKAGGDAMKSMGRDPIDRQHEIWRSVHAHLADHSPSTMEPGCKR